MATIPRASPMLTLMMRRQAHSSMLSSRQQAVYVVNTAHSQCKSRLLLRQARPYASAHGSVQAIQRDSVYNATASQPQKLFKREAASRVPPPVIDGEEHRPSPVTTNLAPTQPRSPFIPDTRYNPPASTRPVALEVPRRQEGQSKVAHLIKVGRAYLSFFKYGFQNINASRKAANQIRHNLAEHKKQFQKIAARDPTAIKSAIANQRPPWTRAEFQLLRRSRHDMTRLPIFGLLFIIFGEFLPLVMFAAKSHITPLLPNTVRLPAQVKAYRQKQLQWRAAVQQKWEGKDANDQAASIDTFARYGAEYFRLGPRLWPLSLQPKRMILRNTRIYYEYLLYDDLLLGREGVQKLIDDEVAIAAIERGVWDDESDVKIVRQRLQSAVLKSLGPEPGLGPLGSASAAAAAASGRLGGSGPRSLGGRA